MISGLDRDWLNTGPRGDNVTGSESVAESNHFIGYPSEGKTWVSEDIGATAARGRFVVFETVNIMLRQIEVAPALGGSPSEDKPAGTGIVSDQLGRAHDGEVLISGIGNLDRQMHRSDRAEDLVHRVGFSSARQIPTEPECKLRFGHAHEVAAKRNFRAGLKDTVSKEPARKWAIDANVRLPGNTGRGNLPSCCDLARHIREFCLNGVSL
jgi:hypothetical protein